ncbi:hypothetical protein PRZ48_007169 [Zasmidium cellare]|uniref:Spindle pole body-associated protein cut12 domain-containing protein n=1 Tax=Zasmidium cellare TaxID=395010 RepID=A0ABR0EIL5_ZASCE|nr:hypothetical protein PRZ48_007169 [Zasmidium cellare]
MLHWLAGQKSHDNDADPDATGYEEPPETPAPVFAVRAFKHAIFGTPATQAKPRRHSNTETLRPRHNGRPSMPRPKSASDTHTLGKIENAIDEEPVPSSPLPSPTKGILLTPGTGTTRRKTVSFGLNVVDNEQKRPMTSGLPDDCPGKFPSPWSKPTAELDSSDELVEKPRGRSRLTEAFEQVREESAKRKPKSSRQQKEKDGLDTTMDVTEPNSESGRYWKHEYDIYRERTTREVKKLVEKQRSAKRYASEKDSECQEVRDELRRERKRADRLEKRAAELEAQLKELQEQVQSNHAGGQIAEVESLPTGSRLSTTSQPKEVQRVEKPERNSWRESLVQLSRRDTKTEETTTADSSTKHKDQPIPAQDRDTAAEKKARPRRIHTKPKDDLWAPSSSLQAPAQVEPNPPSPKATRAMNDTTAAPLQSLSVNTIAQKEDSLSLAMSMGMQPPSPQRENRHDSPIRSPGLPSPSPELPARSTPRPSSWTRKSSKSDDTSILVPESSPFQPEAVSERPNILTGQPVPIKPTLRPTPKAPDVKENVSPTGRSQQPRNEENMKPSAAWNAMSNVAAERRVVSKGKEIEADRLAKARARLQERGRQVS